MQIIKEELDKEFDETDFQGQFNVASGHPGYGNDGGRSHYPPGQPFDHTSDMGFSTFHLGDGTASPFIGRRAYDKNKSQT